MSVPREKLAIVVAASRGGVIGRGGALPWHYPEDLRHFRAVTRGHAVIMGRKTYQSIGRPLPDRRNIVVTRDATFSAPGCEVARSLDEAIALARATDPEPRVIGGAEIYAAALPLATVMYLTEVQLDVDGDVLLPAWDDGAWRETERRESGELVFRTLVR
ncbi:MAG: dihydrofolate reductase, partial [Deltaproteobacteria bacterium]